MIDALRSPPVTPGEAEELPLLTEVLKLRGRVSSLEEHLRVADAQLTTARTEVAGLREEAQAAAERYEAIAVRYEDFKARCRALDTEVRAARELCQDAAHWLAVPPTSNSDRYLVGQLINSLRNFRDPQADAAQP